MTDAATKSVLLTVGTDHHRFDRVVGWVDEWAAENPEIECRVQHGTSAPPRVASGDAYIQHDELKQTMAAAAAVVCHGGPSTILEVQASGHHPLVVPRDPALDEHVDDHQIRFARRLADHGDIHLIQSAHELHAALDRAIAVGPVPPSASEDDKRTAAVAALGSVIDDAIRAKRAARRGISTPAAAAGPKVLLIAGLGRSGSTLLDRMLGQVEGCAAVGEVVHLWTRGLVEGEPCACGASFPSCPFWSAVGQAAFGGWDQIDPTAVITAQRRVERDRHLPLLAGPAGLRPTFDGAVEEYGDYLRAVYEGIRSVTGATWVVDSSKHVATAYLLRRLDDIDLRVAHLVRDSRGVAFSWMKVKRQFEAEQGAAVSDGGASLMARWSPGQTASRYVAYNTLLQALQPLGVPSVRVQYERLVQDPATQLSRVLGVMDLPDADLSFIGDGVADLDTSHTIGGNPMRFQAGPVPLLLDDQWRQGLEGRDRATVTAVTAPLLASYGYLGRGGGRATG